MPIDPRPAQPSEVSAAIEPRSSLAKEVQFTEVCRRPWSRFWNEGICHIFGPRTGKSSRERGIMRVRSCAK